MKIATWNVNSIRMRLAHVTDWLASSSVDVLCLQETKVPDDLFPQAAFAEVGYHSYFYGQKSYNGVALLSRSPLEKVQMGFGAVLPDLVGDLDEQKRVITGVIDGIQVINLYVPNGSALDSDKYVYKLHWLKVLREYLQTLMETSSNLLVCGDFNIALEDIDIHNSKGREKQVMATDAERDALRTVLELGLSDVFRKFTAEGGHFSWWDYRSAAFRRDAGWRIDHHYLTPELYQRAIACHIDKEPRKLEQPSDHTPVIVEF